MEDHRGLGVALSVDEFNEQRLTPAIAEVWECRPTRCLRAEHIWFAVHTLLPE